MYNAKIVYNKKNNQALVFLSRKKLKMLIEKKAKYLQVKEEDLRF